MGTSKLATPGNVVDGRRYDHHAAMEAVQTQGPIEPIASIPSRVVYICEYNMYIYIYIYDSYMCVCVNTYMYVYIYIYTYV